jgi:hypothetical protein
LRYQGCTKSKEEEMEKIQQENDSSLTTTNKNS